MYEIKSRAYSFARVIIDLPGISILYKYFYWKQIKKKNSRLPKTLVVEPYNICNLECTMCPYPDMTRDKEQMQLPLFRKIVDDAVENNFESLLFSFYSEPYMDKLLFDKIKYAGQKGLKTTITTNGTILTEEMLRKTMECDLDYITFSVDSFDKETYEQIRVNADFYETLNNIRKMVEYRNSKNLTKPLISLSAVQHEGDLSLQQMEKVLGGLDLYVVSMKDNRKKNGHQSLSNTSFSSYPCWLPWNHFTIYSDGKVALCCRDFDGAFELGDMNTQTIKESWDSEGFRDIRNMHLEGKGNQLDLCKDCDLSYRQSPFLWWKL